MKKSLFTLGFAIVCAAITFSLAVRAQAQIVKPIAAESSLGMIQATDGNFYGAGATSNFNGGIFRMTATGEISTVYNFCSQPNCADGTQPQPPILGSDGNLYGVAKFGGNSTGSGTFYKLTLDGNLTILYTFCPNAGCADGQYPLGVVQASDGNFYGTTELGGAAGGGSGTVFRITPTGDFNLMYTFCSLANCADGAYPSSPPIQGSGGNFYGTAAFGGATGLGVVYRLTSAGAYTVLYNFCSATHCLDGEQPVAVTQGPDGTLFGLTNFGGNRSGGTVFQINLTRNHFHTLHSFDPYVDGDNSFYSLTLANDGNFYGVVGDSFAAGYIFQVTPEGVYTSLYNFACCGLGSNPIGPLLQGYQWRTLRRNRIFPCNEQRFDLPTLEPHRSFITDRTRARKNRDEHSDSRQWSERINRGDVQRRANCVYGRERYVHQGNSSRRREYWDGFCRDAGRNAQQQSAICGDEVMVSKRFIFPAASLRQVFLTRTFR